MADSQEKTVAELIVTEAVEKGMDTPLRESILDGVDAAGEGPSGGRGLPLAGALFGLGAAIGFLAGRESDDLSETPIGDVTEPEIIEDVVDEVTDKKTDGETDPTSIETDDEPVESTEESDTGGGSLLPKLLLAVAAIVGAVVLRRRLADSDEGEWEPIEEFEPATTGVDEETADSETETDAIEDEQPAGDTDRRGAGDTDRRDAGDEIEE